MKCVCLSLPVATGFSSSSERPSQGRAEHGNGSSQQEAEPVHPGGYHAWTPEQDQICQERQGGPGQIKGRGACRRGLFAARGRPFRSVQ